MSEVLHRLPMSSEDDELVDLPQSHWLWRWVKAGARQTVYPLVTLLVLLGIWDGVTRYGGVDPIVVPPPDDVFRALWNSFDVLMPFAKVTIVETLLGFGLAVGVGVPLGMIIVFSRVIRAAIYPLLVASQMVPKVALAPVFLVWFGTGIASKVMVAFLVAFFPVVISTALGMESVDRDQVRLFRSMGTPRLRMFRKLHLPSSLPSIFAGLKVAMTLAVVGALVGEFVSANSGLGYYIIFQNGQLETAEVAAAVIVVTVVGVLFYFAIEVLERLLSPHRRSGPGIGTTF